MTAADRAFRAAMDAPELGGQPYISVRSEADFQRAVELLLKARPSLLWHHCGRALHCRGGRGFPDLVIVGSMVLFAELKLNGRVSGGQVSWKYRVPLAGGRYVIWGPDALRSGEIAAVLDGLAVPVPG